MIEQLKKKVLTGDNLSKDEIGKLMAISLDSSKLYQLLNTANDIRDHFTGKQVDLCTIINAKSGACSEDCKFCAQSIHFQTKSEIYPLLPYEDILNHAKKVEKAGANRLSLVTSGKGIDSRSFELIIDYYKKLKKDSCLKLCASLGILSKGQLLRLKEVGVTKYHHNLETSKRHYKNMVTTHDYRDRVKTIELANEIGLEVCSGGILGLGESEQDRVDVILELKRLGVKSIPMNVLMPVKGTPMYQQEALNPLEILKVLAVYRFVIPDASIRYAGGRVALGDFQQLGFESGVNGALVGDFLTTLGSDIANDQAMIKKAGLVIV